MCIVYTLRNALVVLLPYVPQMPRYFVWVEDDALQNSHIMTISLNIHA